MADREILQDDALLRRIRDRYDRAHEAWRDIREEGATDMRYVAGDPWKAKDKKARQAAGRPALALDELGQYFNQVINDVRANPRAVKFAPTGFGASDESATFYQEKMREIEYRSNAQVPYIAAFENAVQRSYGFCRVNTEYESHRSRHQNIAIEAIVNPDTVLIDPDAKLPDSSDMRWCFVHETWQIDDVRRRWPDAAMQDFSQYAGEYPRWFTDSTLVLAEYWEIEETDDVLHTIPMPDGTLLDILQSDMDDGTLLMELRLEDWPASVEDRAVRVPTVIQRLTNGVEILEETDWPGTYIPIVSCYGKVIYVDTGSGPKRQILSMTRLARDPYMLYCYYRTTEAEEVGMTPRSPATGYVGQFRGFEKDWQKAAHEPVAYLQAHATTDETGQQLLPLPQRSQYKPAIEALEVGAESARRAIQAAMGATPLPTTAQRRNEKSGVALRRIEESSQKGTYHFIDNYDHMIRHVGVIAEDLMDKVYDTARDVGVIRADDEASTVRINDEAMDPTTAQPSPISTRGDHQVTISTGPAFESQRAAASDFADQIANNPDIFRLIGPLIVKLKNLGPIGDQIADALEILQPPELRQAKDGAQPDPAALQQQVAEADRMMQEMTAKIQELEQAAETDTVKERAKTERDLMLAEIRKQVSLQIQEIKGDQAVRLARVTGEEALELQDDAQRHELGLGAADVAARQAPEGSPPG